MDRTSYAALAALLLAAPGAFAGLGDGPPMARGGGPAQSWQGAHFALGAVPDAALCTALTCDEFRFRLAAPAAGALEVSIRWASEQNDFDLFLYGPDGALAASSAGMISTAEGVLLAAAPAGEYRAVTMPAGVVDSAYEGLVQVEPPRQLRGDLLPDLLALPAERLTLDAPAYFTGANVPGSGAAGLGCGPDEVVEERPGRCLRFDAAIHNAGTGPMEARLWFEGAVPGLVDPAQRAVVQRIYRADGSHRDRAAGTYELHLIHGHAHVEAVAEHRVYAGDDRELRQPLAQSRKSGFCLVDTDLTWWGLHGNAARTYKAPVCLTPNQTDEQGHWWVMGISVGWSDTYTRDLPDQYIDIGGLPDACYQLVSIADPDGILEEARRDNNLARAPFRLSAGGVQEGC